MPAIQSPPVSVYALFSRKEDAMTWYALRIASILIVTHSLLFFPAPVSRAQDRLTETEVKQAQEVANLILKLLEETGDFSRVIDEMYAEDFIERYLQEQIHDGEEPHSSSDLTFASGLNYKRDLLKQATIDDWRRLYIVTNNFLFHIMVIGLNKSADDYLNGREPDDEIFENLIPPKVITLFNNHPVLKYFIDIDEDKPESTEPAEEAQGDAAEKKEETQGDAAEKKEETQGDTAEKQSGPKSIETPEEMRSVTEILQEGLRLLLEEQNNYSPKLTDDAKKAIQMIIQKESIEPAIRVSDKEYFGFPAGVRFLEVPTSFMFMLELAEMNGKQRIVWAELFVPHC
ncbi:MAG: hypothetical protein MOB07_10095 [Acidobacteria bacterium]|nr:hypothetical protein [Acidobacteriota bacterium]